MKSVVTLTPLGLYL